MTQDDILKIAEKAGVSIRSYYDETGSTPQELQRVYELAVATEREACAELCDEISADGGMYHATAIRARGYS